MTSFSHIDKSVLDSNLCPKRGLNRAIQSIFIRNLPNSRKQPRNTWCTNESWLCIDEFDSDIAYKAVFRCTCTIPHAAYHARFEHYIDCCATCACMCNCACALCMVRRYFTFGFVHGLETFRSRLSWQVIRKVGSKTNCHQI